MRKPRISQKTPAVESVESAVNTPGYDDDNIPIEVPKIQAEGGSIQAAPAEKSRAMPAPPPPPPEEPAAPVPTKQKKPRTPAQIAATAKMLDVLRSRHKALNDQKAAEMEAYKRALEERVVKKAVSIKKRQIKQQLALDVISDDDTPIEELLPPKVMRRQTTAVRPAAAAAPKSNIVFV
jgi:hypothetical protein